MFGLTSINARIVATARVLALIAGLLALVALAGYVIKLPTLFRVWAGLEGMSPFTAIALLALAIAAITWTFEYFRIAFIGSAAGAAIGLSALISHSLYGGDRISPWLGQAVFRMAPGVTGRTSTATGLGVLLIAVALIQRRRNPRSADFSAGAGLLLSGMALLGYLYGVSDLYALPIFNSMALNTAAALFFLATAVLFVKPTDGWAGVIGSEEIGGGATRRQLSFVAFPVLAGWILLKATHANRFGPAVAMALLVIVTIVPLVVLVLRDGRVLNALDRERRQKLDIQERLSREMAQQLSDQAEELYRESTERAKAEAAMYRAQRMEAIGQLTGGIAHDFNNLLMAIRGNLELLQRRLPGDEERLHRYLTNATVAADKGSKVTAQLLAFSRSQKLNMKSVELDPVLMSARDLIGNALGPDIDLSISLLTAGKWVVTDPDQLELAILNLAMNARDAMPDGGCIRLESSPYGKRVDGDDDNTTYVAIRVTDNGMGMTEEVMAQAIEPFFTTKELGKGTGLGLAQVYGFVRQCGGDLRIDSKPGKGTTVEILLPGSEPGKAKPFDLLPEKLDGYEGQARGREVLVIDDDDGVRAVIIDALTVAGFKVLEACDGESGLALLAQNQPSAAVIDFIMPGLNGAEVARIAQQRKPGLPIVFVSGYSDTLALDGIAGAVVLRKPFELDELKRVIYAVMS